MINSFRSRLCFGALFNPVIREVVDMHYLWTTPVLLDHTRPRQPVPDLRKTPYSEGIRATIQAMRSSTVKPNA
jgi:hypothetical protein